MLTIQNGFGIPLPHFFQMQTHQAVLEGISILLLHIDNRIRLSDLTDKTLLQEHYIQIALY